MEDIFNYYSRVNFSENEIEEVLNKIMEEYNFHPVKSYKIIETGYEDFNVFVETKNKKFVIKFFSNVRTIKNIYHYIKIIELLSNNKFLNIPKVYKNKDGILGCLEFNGENIYFFVMDYIDGKTVLELDKKIDLKTILTIIFDILKYNCVNKELKDYLLSNQAKEFKWYDMWSYENFLHEYEEKGKYLSNEDKELIEPVASYFKDMIKRYERYDEKFKNKPVIPPYISAHNDFLSTNIILKHNEEPYYIDFSVSSIALNFVDIAVFGCDSVLRNDMDSKEYAKYLRIISYLLYRTHIMEYNLYPTSVAVQHAIHIIITNYLIKCEHVNSEENDYWYNTGKKGLQYLTKENLLNKPVFNWIKNGDWYQRSELDEISEYSIIKQEIKNMNLEEFVEKNIKEYFKLYNKNKPDEEYSNIELDDLYHNGYDWLYSCIDNIKSGETIMAISFCNDNEWNGEKVENLWTKLNIEALNRGVIMKRIFVYPDNKKSLVTNNKDICKFVSYKKKNLELGFVSESEIKKVLGKKLDIIYPGVLVFNGQLAFIDIVGDPENRGYNVFDKDKINELYELYDIVRDACDKV